MISSTPPVYGCAALMRLNGAVTLIALTGGIAAGKSTIARRLQELGAHVLDADVHAREVVAPGSAGLEAIRGRFGDGVISADGTLDRPALGAIVFDDPQARRDLEGITHPAIRELAKRRAAEIRAADPHAIIVNDIPLLVESGLADRYGVILLAHAPASVRRERLIELRGMSADEADRRIAAQASDEDRLAVATHVIRTDVPLAETMAKVEAVWEELRTSA